MPNAIQAPPSGQRLLSIDALRGLVIIFMLLDHVRETFFLHRQVADPMNIDVTEPALFFSRTLAHLCAPVFVLLTGLSAFLYGEKYQGTRDVSAFLFKRGLSPLVVLALTLTFAGEVLSGQQIIGILLIPCGMAAGAGAGHRKRGGTIPRSAGSVCISD